MQFLEAEVIELTRNVWEAFLDLPIERVDDPAEPKDGEEIVSACVHISGEWNGSVILSCSATLATTVAGAMFDLEPEDVDEELLHDAVGEVANMIGGNVKGLVPGPSQLSLPAVATGIHTRLAVPGSHAVTRVGFDSGTEAVHIVLMEVNDAADKGAAPAKEPAKGTETPTPVA